MEEMMACRECGDAYDIDDWEAMGADDGNVICPGCCQEQPAAFVSYPEAE